MNTFCKLSRLASWRQAVTLSAPAYRGFSTPSFDGEMSELYAIVAKQHRHKNGPWLKMLTATESALANKDGPLILLDLASGPGEPGLTIAQHMPQVDVLITDVSPDQVALASKRSEGTSNVTTKIIDIADLSVFPDNSFDVITVCYGYMFTEEKQQAFNESYRVLKPGGTLIATYWKTLQMIEFSQKVLKAIYLEGTIPSPSIDPLALSADGITHSYLNIAGFHPDSITTEQSSYPFDLGSDKELVYKLGVMPAHPKLQELKERGELEALQRGKEAFWKEVSTSENVTIDSEGSYVVQNNVFEMAVAKK